MQPLWDDLKHMANATGQDEIPGLIDTDAEQHDQLEFSTLEDEASTSNYTRLPVGTELIDSEGFTPQDAGHIAHK